MSPTKNKTRLDFENMLAELTEIVDKMEQGGLTLENSLNHFQKGIVLAQQCQKTLQDAEQKVKILIEKNGQANLENYLEKDNYEL